MKAFEFSTKTGRNALSPERVVLGEISTGECLVRDSAQKEGDLFWVSSETYDDLVTRLNDALKG